MPEERARRKQESIEKRTVSKRETKKGLKTKDKKKNEEKV